MEFSIKSGSPEKQRTACVVVGVFEPRKLALAGEMIDQISNHYLSDIIRRGDMEGKSGTTLMLHNVPNTLCDRVLLVGLGKEREFKDDLLSGRRHFNHSHQPVDAHIPANPDMEEFHHPLGPRPDPIPQ